MKADRVTKTSNIFRSTLYDCAFVRNCLNDDSKESHQRSRDGGDT